MALELYSVIKNDAPADVLFWKFAGEDFRTGTQLIVAENEEALFLKDGVIYQTFSGGKFTLTTNNYPFIDKVRSFFSGGVNSFNCKVYFVNKADQLAVKWGTPSSVTVRDPVWMIATPVRGRGALTVRVKDAKKFALKFVGGNVQAVTPEAVKKSFSDAVNEKIKTLIAGTIKGSGAEILETITDLEGFAKAMKPFVADLLDEYGLESVNFYVSALEIPEGDPARARLEEAAANKAQMRMLGEDWQRVQGRDIMMTMAANEGATGSVAGMGAGMGVGMAAGGAFGAVAGSVFAPAAQPRTPQETAACPQCHAKIAAGGRFCPACGARLEARQAFCAGCGKPLQPGAKFCPECGAKQ